MKGYELASVKKHWSVQAASVKSKAFGELDL